MGHLGLFFDIRWHFLSVFQLFCTSNAVFSSALFFNFVFEQTSLFICLDKSLASVAAMFRVASFPTQPYF